MQHGGEEHEEDDVALEYPVELDEFLEYCVAEHGDDFEAISRDFLEVAADLEEPLVSRAQEFFSADALRERWRLLSGEEQKHHDKTPAETVVPAGAVSSGAVSPKAKSADPTSGEGVVDAVQPSGFSIFRDSLKEQMDRIYSDVQTRLPSTFAAAQESDSEGGSDEEPPRALVLGRNALDSDAPTSSKCDAHLSREEAGPQDLVSAAERAESRMRDEPSAAAAAATVAATTAELSESSGALSDPQKPAPAFDAALGQADLLAGVLAQYSAAQGGPQGVVEGDLRQRTIELFGTDDLHTIFSDMQARSNISADVPSFDAVLLSHGVNPQDIEGPFVEPPEMVKGIVDATTPSLQPAPEVPATEAASTPVFAPPPRAPPRPPLPGNRPGPAEVATRETEASGGEASGNEGSGSSEEELSQLRQRAKQTSLELAGTRTSARPAPVRKQPAPVAKRQPARPKFVKLELMESSEEDSDDVEASGETSSQGSESDEALAEDESLRVMLRLLRKAPTGECPWDLWLEGTRKWPRLQVALGSPEFFQREGNLRVAFDLEKLRQLIDDERAARAQRLRDEAEKAEKLKDSAAEFVREAERRRELVMGRFGGGFVLSSRNPQLQAEEANDSAKEAEQEAKRKEEQQEAERTAKRIQREAERLRVAKEREQEEQAARLRAIEEQQQRAEEERIREQQAAEAVALAMRLEEIRTQINRHACPLYDSQVSTGPCVPSLSSHAERLLNEEQGVHGSQHSAIYILPWGSDEGRASAPSVAQRETLSMIHMRCLAKGLLLMRTRELLDDSVPDLASYDSIVLLLVEMRVAEESFSSQLPCGKTVMDVLVGPLPCFPLASLFSRPFAFWADEHSDARASEDISSSIETLCIPFKESSRRTGDHVLAAVLSDVQKQGLSVVGIRSAHPRHLVAGAVTSVAMKHSVSVGQPLLLIAIRGPHALEVWRSLLGAGDPQLARRTDPDSLNARYGGENRSEAIAPSPPSSTGKAWADVVWGFGGRFDSADPLLPTAPLHPLLLSPVQTYAFRLQGPLAFASVGTEMCTVLLRAGKVVSVTADAHGEGLVVAALREGGSTFIDGGIRLSEAPALGGGARHREGCSHIPAVATPCDLPPHRGLVIGSPALPKGQLHLEAYTQGEPELLVIGLRPRVVTPDGVRSVCDGLFEKFGPSGVGADAHPSLRIGLAVDLLAVRFIDMDACAKTMHSVIDGVSTVHQNVLDSLAVLRAFRSFQHVVRRTSEHGSADWWSSADGRSAPIALLCFRGEDLINRFASFLTKEWKLPAAIAGDVLFSPTLGIARQSFSAFFGDLQRSVFVPTVPFSDLRSGLRFFANEPTSHINVSQAALFPHKLSQEFTIALLLPPYVDKALFRVLTDAEQKGFTVVSAVTSGGLHEAAAKLLFEQEVADGHLVAAEESAFLESVGCNTEEDAEGQFRCVWIVLARHQAVKRLAQLCGHGDPNVNESHMQAALRFGRGRVKNGVRCPTSCASAEGLLQALRVDHGSCFAPPAAPELCRLGVEEGMRAVECSLLAVAWAQEDLSVGYLLRELHTAIQGNGLAMVALRVIAVGAPGTRLDPNLPVGNSSDRLHPAWVAARPTTQRLAELASSACPLIFLACEGSRAVEFTKRAAAAVVSAVSDAILEYYTSASSSEAAWDIVHIFRDLRGAKHYIVGDVQ